MPHTVVIHVKNEESVVGEVEQLPTPSDRVLIVDNVRHRDGRDVTYIQAETETVIYPWERINCVEIMPSAREEEVVSFIRD